MFVPQQRINPFGNLSGSIRALLREPAGVSMPFRQGILAAADPSMRFEVRHGARQPQRYEVQALQNNPRFQNPDVQLNTEESEILFELLLQNYNTLLNEQLEAGQTPSWDFFENAMQRAAGGNLPQVQTQGEQLRLQLQNDNQLRQNQAQIDALRKQLKEQKAAFDEKLKKQKETDEEKARRMKAEEEKKRNAAGGHREPGFAGLLKQAQQYDMKIIAIIGMLNVLALPFEVVCHMAGAAVEVAPKDGAGVLTFFQTWFARVRNQFEKDFGFGNEGVSQPGNSDSDPLLGAQALQQQPAPKPPAKIGA